VKFPELSPRSQLRQIVGLTEIEIDYSRPSMKGRRIFGALEPYGEIWRTGANASTKFRVSDDVEMAGAKVPAGTYGLFTIPGEDVWSVILSKKSDLWGAFDYDPSEDFVSFGVIPERLSSSVETFTIEIADLTDSGANLTLEWENTRITIPIVADPHKKVMAQIAEAMASSEPKDIGFLFQAGFYYFKHGEDAIQALAWVDEAISGHEKPPYWMLGIKAEILVALDRRTEVKVYAMMAMRLAIEANNLGFARRMEVLLANID